MDDDAARWDDRYRDSEPAVARPPDALAAHPHLFDALPSAGTALDIACGTGAQSLWLADLGHRVTGLDVSPRAIEIALASAVRAGHGDHVDLRVADLDDGLPDGVGSFDVVVCQRFRHRNLYGAIVDALRPGGIAVVTVLSEVGLGSDPGPFHAPRGELSTAFTRADTEMLLDVESDGNASVVVRRRD